jgi:hypothetical protein
MKPNDPFISQRPVHIPPAPARYSEREWDEVRRAFCSSILADTSLVSLAQNLEGVEWPLTGPSEKPSSYIELEYAEMREQLALRGQPPRVADQLIDILKETLAFDEPFGEMVMQPEEVAAAENPLVKNMAKLKIPGNFPVALTALSPETQLFCKLEGILTLGEFAFAAQRMSGSVVVGGDFRTLLNALSNVDERTLAHYLPYRVGDTGIHYIEGIALAVCVQPVAIQAALAARLRQPLAKDAQVLARTVSNSDVEAARAAINQHAVSMRAYCPDEYAEISRRLSTGTRPQELVNVLGDNVVEAIVADILKPEPTVAPEGLLARFTGWLRK